MKLWHFLLSLLLLNCALNLKATTLCEAPAPAVVQATTVSNDHATISWSPVANAQSYLVSTTQINTGVIVASAIVSGTSYSVNNLTSGEDYNISIRASYCDFGPFGPPLEASFRTEIIVVDVILQSGCVDEPNAKEDEYAAGDVLNIELDVPACYLLHVESLGTEPQFEFSLAFTSLKKTRVTIGNLESNPGNFALLGNGPVNGVLLNSGGTIPLLTIKSVYQQGVSYANIVWQQNVATTLVRCSSCNFSWGGGIQPFIADGTPSTTSDAMFQLYPNPVKEQLNIKLPAPAQVEVWDMVGRKWATLGQREPHQFYSVDVNDWPPGTYIVRWCVPNRPPEARYFLKHGL